jgi:PAS domain S-box-containing protein
MAKRKRPLGRRASSRRVAERAAKPRARASKKEQSPGAAFARTSPPLPVMYSNFPRLFQQSAQQSLEHRPSSSAVAAWLSSQGSARALMNLAHDAVIIRNPENIIESWNLGAQELYGWTPEEAIGRVSHDLLGTRFPKDLAPIVQTLGESGYWEGELDHRRKDGKRITVLSRWSLLRTSSGFPLLIKEINRDVTQERRQFGYLRLLNEVGSAIMKAESVFEALRSSLASICAHTRWCMGRAFSLTGPGSIQRPEVLLWQVSDEQRLGPVRQALDQRRERIGEAPLAARALESNHPVWIENIATDPYFKNIPELAQAGIASAFAQPIIASGTQAALLLLSDLPAEIDEPFLSTMSSVAAHLCRFFDRLAAQEAQRRLSISLLRAQDDERRRIARELHDSAGQYLGALGLSLEAVRRTVPPEAAPVVEEKLAEAEDIIARCSADLRTLSHLLHPPLLEDLGLASAVNWYISGFAERSGIQINAEISKLPRFDHSVELTLFRILQECLTNIHRHSGSKTASVALAADTQSVTLKICDEGKGISQETLRGWSRNTHRAGVGINGMRERLNDLGGALEITSDKRGTTVCAHIPLRRGTDTSALTDNASPRISFTLQDASATNVVQSQSEKSANGSQKPQAHVEKAGNGPAEKQAESSGRARKTDRAQTEKSGSSVVQSPVLSESQFILAAPSSTPRRRIADKSKPASTDH